MAALNKSKRLFRDATRVIPGGVNSPVRAFRAVGPFPVFIDKAKGPYVYDVDGNKYIDYCLSWGPMILGHARAEVLRYVKEVMAKGTSFGIPTELEIRLAKMIVQAIGSVEQVRLVSSGTEAVMTAIRLARGCTGRDKIIKFIGCYHGHVDHMLVQAGSGATTLGVPSSPGVPKDFTKHTALLPYNDPEAVRKAFGKYQGQIAAVIVEPIAGNMGVVPPRDGFLKTIRQLCTRNGSILIFDEVITGFRLAYGSVQDVVGVKADLTCLGKIIGGGFPIGACGGKAELMEQLAPTGRIYQAGTLSGNASNSRGYIPLSRLQPKPSARAFKRPCWNTTLSIPSTVWVRCSLCSLILNLWPIMPRPRGPTPRCTRDFIVRCFEKAFICRRLNSRLASFRLSTSRRTLKGPSKPLMPLNDRRWTSLIGHWEDF
jgi:glutamate-1-semialdehyde 2,1-aminomutase